MENMGKTISAVVIESRSRGENQVVTACGPAGAFHFFFLPSTPDVDFGDLLQMDFNPQSYFVHHGNPHLTYKITPLVFPETLLYELIIERVGPGNPEEQE